MSDIQHISGVIDAVITNSSRCGMHVSWGSAPTVPEPWGIWWDTDKDCLAYTATDGTVCYAAKGNGTSGQVLTSNGASTAPSFKAVTSEILAMQTANGIGSAGPFADNIEQQVSNPFNVFPAGTMNAANRRMVTHFDGVFQSGIGEIPTIDFSLELATFDIITITSGAVTASVAAGAWDLLFETIALNTGATAIVQSTAKLIISLAGTSVFTTYIVKASQSAANIDLTGTSRPKLNAKVHGTALTGIIVNSASVIVYPALIP